MYVTIERDELPLLIELVQGRVAELHPEIRRSRDFRYTEKLKVDLKTFENLLRRLHEAECDVTA